jgi:hypothetical protein
LLAVVPVSVICALIGHEVKEYKRQKQLAAIVHQNGGVVIWSLNSIVTVSFHDQQLDDLKLSELIVHLEQMPSLTQLDLGRTCVGDSGVAQLVNLSSLEELSLGDTYVTDAGVAPLTKLSRLKTVWVGGTFVTERGLETLATLPRLRTLRVDQFSPEGRSVHVSALTIANLKKRFPKLGIVTGSGWAPTRTVGGGGVNKGK